METKIPQQIPTLLDRIAVGLGRGDPAMTDKYRVWLESVGREMFGEAWKDGEKCFNCHAKMYQYTYTIGLFHARTMMKLGAHVRERLAAGKPFTQANEIHISGLAGYLSPTEIDQKTQLKYLGFLAKVRDEDDHHRDSLWAITSWGFAFLRNEPVAAGVTIWRKKVVERSNEMTTLSDVLSDAGSSFGAEGFIPYEREVHMGLIA